MYIETLVIELKGDYESTLIASCYRAPNVNQREFISSYQTQIELLKKNSDNIIIGLNHNMDLLKCHSQRLTNKFFEINLSMWPQSMYNKANQNYSQ